MTDIPDDGVAVASNLVALWRRGRHTENTKFQWVLKRVWKQKSREREWAANGDTARGLAKGA
jgi:hypothetical protein